MSLLGYAPFEAGISNQKLALLGLALKGREEKRSVSLPYIQAFPKELGQPARPADASFSREGLTSAFSSLGVEIGGHGYGDDDPESCFAYATRTVANARRAGDQALFDACATFLAHLRPIDRLSDLVAAGRATLDELGVRVACQMRIERDWTEYVAQARARFGEKERPAMSPDDILAKIRATMPGISRLYVTVDTAQLGMSLSDLRAIGRGEGFELIVKDDILPHDLPSQIDRSLFDFEIAIALDDYIGNTRSTFFNVATMTAHGRGLHSRFWTWNNASQSLRLRTDQGAFPRPGLATIEPGAAV